MYLLRNDITVYEWARRLHDVALPMALGLRREGIECRATRIWLSMEHCFFIEEMIILTTAPRKRLHYASHDSIIPPTGPTSNVFLEIPTSQAFFCGRVWAEDCIVAPLPSLADFSIDNAMRI
jgi:hypothetical protein